VIWVRCGFRHTLCALSPLCSSGTRIPLNSPDRFPPRPHRSHRYDYAPSASVLHCCAITRGHFGECCRWRSFLFVRLLFDEARRCTPLFHVARLPTTFCSHSIGSPRYLTIQDEVAGLLKSEKEEDKAQTGDAGPAECSTVMRLCALVLANRATLRDVYPAPELGGMPLQLAKAECPLLERLHVWDHDIDYGLCTDELAITTLRGCRALTDLRLGIEGRGDQDRAAVVTVETLKEALHTGTS